MAALDQPDVREVPLSGGWKLVLIAKDGTVYVRLRAVVEGEWAFLTPPLPLSGADTHYLATEGTAGVDLRHERMDGKLNLLVFQGKLHAHLHGFPAPRNGSASNFQEALEELAETA